MNRAEKQAKKKRKREEASASRRRREEEKALREDGPDDVATVVFQEATTALHGTKARVAIARGHVWDDGTTDELEMLHEQAPPAVVWKSGRWVDMGMLLSRLPRPVTIFLADGVTRQQIQVQVPAEWPALGEGRTPETFLTGVTFVTLLDEEE